METEFLIPKIPSSTLYKKSGKQVNLNLKSIENFGDRYCFINPFEIKANSTQSIGILFEKLKDSECGKPGLINTIEFCGASDCSAI